ncbi:MAG: hypothetical protein Q8K69_03530, partial [Bacteroidota bacterium]|nr:hypothetical protein [Bacteroidota bacterium]
MTEDIFHKILNNTASEAEKSEFFTSLENNPEKQSEFYHYKNLYVLSNLNPAKYRVQQNKSFIHFWERIQAQKPHRLINQWMRYAAIFIVALSLGFMADYFLNNEPAPQFSQHIEYSSEKGSVS